MTWHKHINYITAKASQRLGQMYRCSVYFNKFQRSRIYLNMIRPILQYGSILYDNCTAHDSMKLESIQRRAAILVSGSMRRTENNKIMHLLGWSTLGNRRQFSKLVMLFKIANNLTPLYLTQNVQCKVSIQNLRSASKQVLFREPMARLACYKKSFFPSVIKRWNQLPGAITDSQSLGCFKVKLKMHGDFLVQQTNCPIFNVSYGYYGKILTQMNLNPSKLNHHLFAYNLSDNPFCPNCFDYIEDVNHYFSSVMHIPFIETKW